MCNYIYLVMSNDDINCYAYNKSIAEEIKDKLNEIYGNGTYYVEEVPYIKDKHKDNER